MKALFLTLALLSVFAGPVQVLSGLPATVVAVNLAVSAGMFIAWAVLRD